MRYSHKTGRFLIISLINSENVKHIAEIISERPLLIKIEEHGNSFSQMDYKVHDELTQEVQLQGLEIFLAKQREKGNIYFPRLKKVALACPNVEVQISKNGNGGNIEIAPRTIREAVIPSAVVTQQPIIETKTIVFPEEKPIVIPHKPVAKTIIIPERKPTPPKNQTVVKKTVSKPLSPSPITKHASTMSSSKFRLMDEFELVVEDNYIHDHQFERMQAYEKCFGFISDTFMLQDPGKVSVQLMPGLYKAGFVKICSRILDTDECVNFLKTNNALLIAGPGLSYIWIKERDRFPKGRTLSFDEKDLLLVDSEGYHRIPGIDKNRQFDAVMDYYECGLNGDYNMLCVRTF